MPQDARRGSWRALACLLGSALVFSWLRVWQTSGQQIQIFVNFDVLMYWLPLLREAARQWATQGPPLWNPYQALGTPLLATQQVAALYPFNALYLALDVGGAWLATGLAHHLIAAAGMYGFCRVLGLSRGGAAVGAGSYAFSAVLIEKYINLPDEFICLAWLPAMFASAEWLLQKPAGGRATLLAVVWAFHVLGGDADTIARAALLLGAYTGVRIVRRAWHTPWQALAAAAWAALAVALTAGLTAAQWLPTFELVQHSVRALGTLSAAQQSGFSADPRLLVSNHIRGIPTLSIGSTMPLILALVGLGAWRRRLQAWFFALAAALVIVLAMGAETPLFALVRQLPTGTWFRAPLRFLNLWPQCVAPLAAGGADVLLGSDISQRRRCRMLVGSGVLVAGAQAWASVGTGRGAMAFAGVALTLAALSVVSLAVTPRRQRTTGRGWAAAIIVLLIAAVPSALFQPEILSPYRVAEVYGPQAGLFAALHEQVPARVLSLLPVADGRSWAKLGSYFEVPVLNDFEPLSLSDFQTFAEVLRGAATGSAKLQEALDVFTGDPVPPRGTYNARLLNLSGVRFVVAPAGDAAEIARWFGPDTRLVPWTQSGAVVVYENPDVLARTFFIPAGNARVAGSDCPRALATGVVDARQELLIEAPGAVQAERPSVSAATVNLRSYAPSAVGVSVATDVAGYLVLTDAFYPGWKAYVDGGEQRILRADCFFRAVPVPPGTHVVRFSYAPSSFRAGVCVSGVAFVLALGVPVIGALRLRRTQN